jgi:hypothetical protein
MGAVTVNDFSKFLSKSTCGGDLSPILEPRTVFVNGQKVCVIGDRMKHSPEEAIIVNAPPPINNLTVFVQGFPISVNGDFISDHFQVIIPHQLKQIISITNVKAY